MRRDVTNLRTNRPSRTDGPFITCKRCDDARILDAQMARSDSLLKLLHKCHHIYFTQIYLYCLIYASCLEGNFKVRSRVGVQICEVEINDEVEKRGACRLNGRYKFKSGWCSIQNVVETSTAASRGKRLPGAQHLWIMYERLLTGANNSFKCGHGASLIRFYPVLEFAPGAFIHCVFWVTSGPNVAPLNPVTVNCILVWPVRVAAYLSEFTEHENFIYWCRIPKMDGIF